ncbi:hypothetical protein H2248_003453 [Termitomyces sp. 'cryptogamus']|nr:hypothetical protein H2248_003453 [Termitomyces sp. 'cryptogamus']
MDRNYRLIQVSEDPPVRFAETFGFTFLRSDEGFHKSGAPLPLANNFHIVCTMNIPYFPLSSLLLFLFNILTDTATLTREFAEGCDDCILPVQAGHYLLICVLSCT